MQILAFRKEIRLSEEAFLRLKYLSETTGRTSSDVIRDLIMGVTLREKPPKDFYVELNRLGELGTSLKNIDSVEAVKLFEDISPSITPTLSPDEPNFENWLKMDGEEWLEYLQNNQSNNQS